MCDHYKIDTLLTFSFYEVKQLDGLKAYIYVCLFIKNNFIAPYVIQKMNYYVLLHIMRTHLRVSVLLINELHK